MISNPRIFPDVSYYKQTGTSPLEVWYPLCDLAAFTSSELSFTTGVLRAMPFFTGKGFTMDVIACECTTGVANAKARIGIYDSTSETNLYPNKLLVDSGEFDMSTNAVKSASISLVLKPNRLYWAVSLCGTAGPKFRSFQNTSGRYNPVIQFPNGMGTGTNIGISVSLSYGALPSTFTAGATPNIGTCPMLFGRFSS